MACLLDQLESYYYKEKFEVSDRKAVKFNNISFGFNTEFCADDPDEMISETYHFTISLKDPYGVIHDIRYYYDFVTPQDPGLAKSFGYPKMITGINYNKDTGWVYKDAFIVHPENTLAVVSRYILPSILGFDKNLIRRVDGDNIDSIESLAIANISLPGCKYKNWLYVYSNKLGESATAISIDHSLYMTYI